MTQRGDETLQVFANPTMQCGAHRRGAMGCRAPRIAALRAIDSADVN
jgi:hypothetical protein